MKRIPRWMIYIGIVLLLPVLLLVIGLIFQAISQNVDARAYPSPGRLVDVAGHQMHLYCTGEQRPGVPVVILDASYPATVSSWIWIQPQVQTAAYVCAYDRAGSGWSELSALPPTMGQMAEDLHLLLAASEIEAPYLLVGHSWGGGVTRLFVSKYPEEVSGLVWIEATHPDTWARKGLPDSTLGGMPPEQVAGIPALARIGVFRLFPGLRASWGIVPGLPDRQQAELFAYFNSTKWADHIVAVESALPQSLAQLRQSGPLGDIPLAVVIGGASENASGVSLELQWELAALSTNSQEYRIEGADHSSLVHEQRYAEQTGEVVLEMIARLRQDN
jgi:pimeloyl-ACP methyl ester carboxylesterase